MKRIIIILNLLFLLVLVNVSNNSLFSQKVKKTIVPKIDITRSYLPPFDESSVVKIFNYKGLKINPGLGLRDIDYAYPKLGHGSGVMIDPSGIILTAKHVIEGARFIAVKIPGNNLTFPAEVVFMDDNSDYSFLVIKGNHRTFVNLPLSPPSIQIGQQIWTYGYPIVSGEPEPNITKGIITRYSKKYRKWQLDASIYGGNSGGPMVTDNGTICGVIVSGIKDTRDLNFSLSIDTILITNKNLKESGIFSLYKKKIEDMNPILFQAKSSLANYFANVTMSYRLMVPDKDFETLKSAITSIQDTNLFVREWAIFKEITASIYFNEASYILDDNYKTIYTAKDLPDKDLKEYINLLEKAKQEILIALTIDKTSSDALKDISSYTDLYLSMVKTNKTEMDDITSSAWSKSEIHTIATYFDTRWSANDIQSLLSYIGLRGSDFKRKWNNNPQDDKEEGISCIKYSNLFVALNNDYVNSISFYCKHLPNEKIPSFRNINPHGSKNDIISILGDDYKINFEGTENIKEIYAWTLNDFLKIAIAFNHSGKVYQITIFKK